MTGHSSGNTWALIVIELTVLVCLFASLTSASDKTPSTDQPPAGSNEVLVLSFFRDNGQTGTFLAYSEDGLRFVALNDDKPVFAPAPWPGQNLTRDPSIVSRINNKVFLN